MSAFTLLDWFQFFCCGLFNLAGAAAIVYHFVIVPASRLEDEDEIH